MKSVNRIIGENSILFFSIQFRGTRKTQKLGNKQTLYPNNDEENSKVAENKDDCEEDDDKEYCIQECLMGRNIRK